MKATTIPVTRSPADNNSQPIKLFALFPIVTGTATRSQLKSATLTMLTSMWASQQSGKRFWLSRAWAKGGGMSVDWERGWPTVGLKNVRIQGSLQWGKDGLDHRVE